VKSVFGDLVEPHLTAFEGQGTNRITRIRGVQGE
jgi:hypothetical protein